MINLNIISSSVLDCRSGGGERENRGVEEEGEDCVKYGRGEKGLEGRKRKRRGKKWRLLYDVESETNEKDDDETRKEHKKRSLSPVGGSEINV